MKDGDDDNNQYIYAYMAHMFVNEESSNIDFGKSFQLKNIILYLGSTCHITPQVSIFLGSLEGMDKYIEVADGHCVMGKQRG